MPEAVQLAGREPRMCGEGTHGLGPLRAPCPCTQSESPAATGPFQLLRGLQRSWFPGLITNNVFCPHLIMQQTSAAIWPHFLVWDVRNPVTIPERREGNLAWEGARVGMALALWLHLAWPLCPALQREDREELM